jgi:quinol-cytochrome oxidoreductase complex cytochrome b subunit
MKNASKSQGLSTFFTNIISLKDSFMTSFLRTGKPSSNRARTSLMVNNFFLHIQGARTHENTLRPNYTFGLGLISFFLLVITIISGGLLMIYYVPSIESAYNSIKDINYVVSFGRIMRNIHKWAGEGMIIFVMLHMARVFYTSSYKKGREFNWVIGIGLMVLTFILNFTGYLLPWDQLSYWALVIGSNIAQSPKEITDILGITNLFDIGSFQKEMFLGGTTPGVATLSRVYFAHIILLPLALFVLLGVHFWRIKKDGGLTRPEKHESTQIVSQKKSFNPAKTYGLMALVNDKTPAVENDDIEGTFVNWPHLLRAEIAVFALCLAGVLIYSFYIDAPLKELANPLIPENPAKAPWYFLGLQELVSYSAFMGGIGIPTLVLLSLALVPYLDREPRDVGIWFSDGKGLLITFISFLIGAAVLIGMLAFVIKVGWFRNFWPDIPQVIILLINPGTLWVGFVTIFALFIIRSTSSTRNGAIAMFSLFLISFLILTYVGTELRGPNWDFYWSKSLWPEH